MRNRTAAFIGEIGRQQALVELQFAAHNVISLMI
jgi:hypothetical protein